MLTARALTRGVRVGWSSALLSAAAAFLTPIVCGPVPAGASTSVSVLAPGRVVETSVASVEAAGTTPADGRLRGPDYTAVITEVAWPQAVDGIGGSQVVAGTGDRLVAFTLSLTQPAEDAGILGPATAVDASLRVGRNTLPVSMQTIDQEIEGGSPGTALTTGTDGFAAAVPAHQDKVAIVLSEGSFSQSFDLWTLTRLPPSPAVLYRDRRSYDVSGSPSGVIQLNLTNPADGFTSTDSTDVSSTDLTWFAPDGSGTTPSDPNNAFLVVNLQSVSNDGYSAANDGGPGDFFSSFNPLPANMLTFTPAGGTPITATTAPLTSSSGEANGDDGLFDAHYWFTVPATTTTGTVMVAAGTVSGVEYIGYEGDGNNVPITITGPASLTLSFRETNPPAHQAKPAWIGAPLPPTGTGAALAGGTAAGSIQGGGGGFPIWLAVVLVVLLAATVVGLQRRRGRLRTVVVGGAISAAPSTADPGAEAATARSPDAVAGDRDPIAPRVPWPAPAVPAPAQATPAPPPGNDALTVLVLGPPQVRGWRQEPDRRIVPEILTWLVLHDTHPHNADEIQVALRPKGDRPDPVRKTFHTYLSALRQCVGAEHLPDAVGAGGYRVVGVGSDWHAFSRMSSEADRSDGPEAIALRTAALQLVRGVPFQGVRGQQYEWALDEQLHQMTSVIVACALRLANDLFDLGRYGGSEEAARAGLRAAPRNTYLEAARDRAADARNEGLVHPGRTIGDSAAD